MEKNGDLTAYLAKNNKSEYNKYWNNQVRAIKREYLPVIEERLKESIEAKGLPQEIISDIKFNLVTLFMANFYSEYYSDVLLKQMLAIYLSGHLPCGWFGDYPNGKMMVY